jgi:hypothetical protein
MDDAKWEKYAALGGVAFVVLNIVGAATTGEPPAPDDSADKVNTWFADHSGAIKLSQFLGALSVIALLWWFGSLWRKMTAAEGGRHRLSVVAALGLVFGGALFMVANAMLSATAMRLDDAGGGSTIFYTLSTVLLSTAGAGVLTFLAAVSLLALRTKMLPAWMAYLGLLSAALFLVATIGSASDSSAFMIFGLFGFITWCIWVLGVSFELWKRPASAIAAIPVAAVVVAVE